LKRIWRARLETWRHRLVLTREEKRVLAFVVIAFALGLTTKHYRDNHPQVAPKIDDKTSSQQGTTKSKSSPRKPRKKSPAPVFSPVDRND
jgi:hypothetical protein